MKTVPILGSDDRMMIKKKGVFDFNKMYADIYKWFLEKKYEFHETDHKFKGDGGGGTGEFHEITLQAWRDEDEWARWRYWIIITMWDALPVLVNTNGESREMIRARIKFDFKFFFDWDWKNRFEGTKFKRTIRDFMISKIFERKIKVEGDKFEYEFHELMELIKKDLGQEAVGNQFAHMWK